MTKRALGIVVIGGLLCGQSWSEELILKKEMFSGALQVDANVIPQTFHSLSLFPEKWKDLVVAEALPQGTKVKQGDKLVHLETQALEKEIAQQKKGNVSRRLNLKLMIAELQNLEKTTEGALKKAKLTYERKKEDHDYFKEVTLPNAKKNTVRSYESSKHRLEYIQEEYDQLKKMYEADDLTEETEEIILKRTARSVENAKRGVEEVKRNTDWTLKTKLKRDQADWEAAEKSAMLAHELAKVKLKVTLEQKKEAVAKESLVVKEWEKYVKDLESDLALLTVTSPVDGTVFYGSFEKGYWNSAAAQKVLVKGGKIVPKTTFMTVIPERSDMALAAFVPIYQRSFLKIKQLGDVKFNATVEKTALKVSRVSRNPSLGGKWRVDLRVDGELKGFVQPGSSVQCTVYTQSAKERIMVPHKFVTKGDDGIFKIDVKMADGKIMSKAVKLGVVALGKVELKSGGSEGQVIVSN